MKAYLIKYHRENEFHCPDEYNVCINSKLHMEYLEWPYRSIGRPLGQPCGKAGAYIDRELSCFSPCDGKRCIDKLFHPREFTKNHVLTPGIREFLEGVLAKESKEEIPEKFIPYIERVLTGEDAKKVWEEMLEKQRYRLL